MALEATQRLDELTVAQLRQMARERGIKRYSRMKKAELIKALDRADTAAQTEDDSDRAADTRATADHDEIRAWADERNAVPATEEGAGEATRPSSCGSDSRSRLLRISSSSTGRPGSGPLTTFA